MGLHMLEPYAFCRRDSSQCTDLLRDGILDFTWRGSDLASTEADEIRKARMRSHCDTMLASQHDSSAHDARVSCMKPAGDIR